jgi:hypothetical protein
MKRKYSELACKVELTSNNSLQSSCTLPTKPRYNYCPEMFPATTFRRIKADNPDPDAIGDGEEGC